MAAYVVGKQNLSDLDLAPGQLLLAAAGVQIYPFAPRGLVYVADASGDFAWVVSDIESEGARQVADDVVIVGKAVPLRDEDIEPIRSAALAELARMGRELSEAPVTLDGFPPLGVGASSRADWGSLLDATHAAVALGLNPVAAGVYPFPFPARDGTVITLQTPADAYQLLLALFAAGSARRKSADAASVAIVKATSAAQIASELNSFRSAHAL